MGKVRMVTNQQGELLHAANPAITLCSMPNTYLSGLADAVHSITLRNSVMKTFAVSLIAFLAFAQLKPLFAEQTTKIQEAQIIELLKALDSAILKKDAKSACTNFAEDAVITIVLYERGEKYTDTYTKKKYQQNLEAGFSDFDDYTAKRSATQVQIATDGKTATAASTFVEEFRRNGIKMACTTKESYSFVLRDGRIVIKTMSNVAKMQ